MRARRSAPLAICLLAGLIALAGLALPRLGTDTAATYGRTAPPPTPAGTEPAAHITIQDFSFGVPIIVAAGSPIEIVNADGTAHTLTAKEGGFATGQLGGGQRVTVTAPGTQGTVTFFCEIHPQMTGSLTVTN